MSGAGTPLRIFLGQFRGYFPYVYFEQNFKQETRIFVPQLNDKLHGWISFPKFRTVFVPDPRSLCSAIHSVVARAETLKSEMREKMWLYLPAQFKCFVCFHIRPYLIFSHLPAKGEKKYAPFLAVDILPLCWSLSRRRAFAKSWNQ